MKPFRWNLKKREQLGYLLKGEVATHYSGYLNELRVCSANVLGYSDNSRMIFVGRSAENIFDYLSGILDNTSFEGRVDMLNISNRFDDISILANKMPDSYRALKEHFISLSISPTQLMNSKNSICFVDFVCEGFTFDRLFEFIDRWCSEENIDKKSVWENIKFIGITSRTKNSPNTVRWYQHTIWMDYKYKIKTQSISIPYKMWDYMGNYQCKVTSTNKPESWSNESILLPSKENENLKALRLAYKIYTRAVCEKMIFTKELGKVKYHKYKWIRDILYEIRNS